MPPMSPPMRSGQPRLSEAARFLAAPSDIASTGWPAVRLTCGRKLGVEFDPWQDGAGRLILAKRADGTLASMVDGVGMSLPRQVGKTYLIGALIFALCVNTPGLLVIWTAHHLKTSGETFLYLQGFAGRPKVAPFIKYVHTGSGDEEIAFHNGARILFGARERGFGRGIPGVDALIFDEAQILSDKALANMLATLNTSSFGLQLYIGTPPKPEDMSESFKRMRREAKDGTLVDGAWIEFGADPDSDPDDRAQWRKMNPSYPKRTPAQSLLRLKRKLTAADWRREGQGIWDEDQEGSRLITAPQWSALSVQQPPAGGVKSFGVAFSVDGKRVAVAGAMRHDDGVHVELVGAHSGSSESGIASLADWLAERWRDTATIVISGRSGAGVLHEALRSRGVSARALHVASTVDYFTSCAMFLNDVVESSAMDAPTLTHLGTDGQAALDASVSVCDKKMRGLGGSWGWVATTTDGDDTPIEAVSLANWGAKTSKRRPGRASRAVVMQ